MSLIRYLLLHHIVPRAIQGGWLKDITTSSIVLTQSCWRTRQRNNHDYLRRYCDYSTTHGILIHLPNGCVIGMTPKETLDTLNCTFGLSCSITGVWWLHQSIMVFGLQACQNATEYIRTRSLKRYISYLVGQD